ncbi:IS630 family transposase [Leptolyngbya sp. PCC 6406]|uniref:IS630 family transposase n=1 Tax=Leptolyngbya sp. PCC 6406 TaxID=1173264 RepID=UPI000481DEBB|nr:IS630 family transposase [Leptolyngbya sp. PCC 6406]
MKAYSTDLRQKIIETYENERISQRQLAQRFRVTLSFIVKLLKQYRETGELAPKTSPGRPRELDEAQMQRVQAFVEANPDLTLDELRAEVAQQYGVTVSRSTMCRVMKRLQFTRKKKALHPSDKVSDRVQRLRGEYWDEIRDIRVEDLVFIDESGINLGLIRLFAWALQGRRAYGEQPKRGKNVSLVAGLSLAGVVASAVILGAFDGLSFEAFVATRLVPNLWPGACVVMDNCSIHKDDMIRELIEAAGARLVYLPPYSPDFSPIENFWSKLKSILRALGARTYQALSEALEIAFEDISEADIKSWFTHCCYCAA